MAIVGTLVVIAGGSGRTILLGAAALAALTSVVYAIRNYRAGGGPYWQRIIRRG